MRWINAEAKIRMQIYDEEHEEYITREMTVEDALDAYTEDGCPTTVDAEPIRHGHWIYEPKDAIEMMDTLPKCSECGYESADGLHYCSNCGAKMDEVKDE